MALPCTTAIGRSPLIITSGMSYTILSIERESVDGDSFFIDSEPVFVDAESAFVDIESLFSCANPFAEEINSRNSKPIFTLVRLIKSLFIVLSING
jgi:hypothetical protein